MGSWNFFSQTQPLNGNHLNLGAWHGFQEVITQESFDFNQAEFNLLLKNQAYLFFYYRLSDGQKLAIKLSNQPQDSACLEIDGQGKFENRTPLPELELPTNQWLTVSLIKNANQVELKVNGQEFSCPLDFSEPLVEGATKNSRTAIGFRGSLNEALIDEIKLTEADQTVFKENFSGQKLTIPLIGVIFATLLIGQIIASKVLIKRKKSDSDSRQVAFGLILFQLMILLSVVISYFYLLFFFTGNYPSLESVFSRLKKQEAAWVDDEISTLSQKIVADHQAETGEKVMLVGSSQTWGAGASSLDTTFGHRLEELLNQQLAESDASGSHSAQVLGISTDQPIKVINTGISGTTSNDLLAEYKKHWLALAPKVTIINLANNDDYFGVTKDQFSANLQEFIDLNKEKQIKTILVVEARSNESSESESPHQEVKEFQQVVKEVAAINQIPVIDLNQYLENQIDSGLLWWDFVHPTDYGHSLIAKFLLEEIGKIRPNDIQL